jgi:hypothetical protein
MWRLWLSSKWMDHILCLNIVIVILVLSIITDVSKLNDLTRSSKLIMSQIMFNMCEHYWRLTKQATPSLTNFMQYSRFWEASSLSATQEIPRIYLRVHYLAQKSAPGPYPALVESSPYTVCL